MTVVRREVVCSAEGWRGELRLSLIIVVRLNLNPHTFASPPAVVSPVGCWAALKGPSRLHLQQPERLHSRSRSNS